MRTALVFVVMGTALVPASAPGQEFSRPPGSTRFATFNASLNRSAEGELIRVLSTPDNVQARNVAEVIQRVRPDVILINEFDYDNERAGQSKAASLFLTNYLRKGQNGAEAIDYPYAFVPTVNTGVSTGADLDNDGRVETSPGSRGYGNDAQGFGQFPGQYGFVIYSKFPFEPPVRQFQTLLWKDMPEALLPTKPDGSPWYSRQALGVLRLSSKNHCDVGVKINGKLVHLLASHPTPPAFDGPEHRNGKRNHDEIRLWADYLTGGSRSAYLARALPPNVPLDSPETFVVMGDLNSDPVDGGSVPGAIDQLLKHPRVNSASPPRSAGAVEAARIQKGANDRHRGDPAFDTADFSDASVGNLRADYVLPSKDLKILGGGVFWPVEADPLSRLVRMGPTPATSDHRLVYLDVGAP